VIRGDARLPLGEFRQTMLAIRGGRLPRGGLIANAPGQRRGRLRSCSSTEALPT